MKLSDTDKDIIISALELYADRNYERGNREWAIKAQDFLNRIRMEQRKLQGIEEEVIEDVPIK